MRRRGTYGRICDECGCYLDPEEECDCVKKRREMRKRQAAAVRMAEGLGSYEQQELAIV